MEGLMPDLDWLVPNALGNLEEIFHQPRSPIAIIPIEFRKIGGDR
jgi:hypothetical protein